MNIDGHVDTQHLIASARRVLEDVFPRDDEAALRELVTEDFVNHEAPPGVPPGPESVIYYMHLLNRAFSDQQWTIEKAISDGDTVAIYCTHSGRHTGDFFGLPATGRSFSYRQMHLIRMRGDQGAEHWAVRDDASLHRQLTGVAD
ncbi:MAG TPA: ester cyclase [Lapillicoccus sp.]|nr:ester cyclase [Lapillicoccus sp.]